MDVERGIARVARKQHGLATRSQAISRGMTRRMIEGRLRSGVWVLRHPAVYAVAGAPASWEQAVLAACLAGGGGTVASHGTALRLWDLTDKLHTDAVHVASPPNRRIRLEGVTSHRTLLLPDVDLARRLAIPTVTVARSIVEVSGAFGVDATSRLLDLAIRRRRGELEAVRACTARLAGPGRRKLSVIREVLALRLPGHDAGDSDLEVRALRVLHRAGLGLPAQQHRVKIGGRTIRIDLAFPEQRIAIELDGWDAHGVRSAFDADRARANELVILGWRVVRFTSTTPAEVLVDQVRRLLNTVAA